ncbi:hypothetical protein FQN52_005644 [Onygenales sp. PD_12]|nr:hypothetical protein FQN52_005644 [Onygenales sp. PD_12]
MKFLCLPGAPGNADAKRLSSELESDNTAAFHFTQGTIPSLPPPGFDNYFGPFPSFRFLTGDIAWENHPEVIRNFPKKGNPEDSIRAIVGGPAEDSLRCSRESIKNALDQLLSLIDEDEEIEGIIGYSEGAGVGASLVLEEQRRFKMCGRAVRIKCAVFISGWPPIYPKTGEVILADETEEEIRIPTVHVLGANDPFVDGSLALYNLCEADSATMFDHGGGHVIPQEERTLRELAEAVRETVKDGLGG